MSSAPETTDVSDPETDPGYRSRSQSRRARRRKQQNKTPKKQNMPPVPENQSTNAIAQSSARSNDQEGSAKAQSSAETKEAQKTALAQRELDEMSPADQVEAMGMQAFEWIGPEETSMNGPVTYAKAQRGEIAPRRGNTNQSLATGSGNKGDDDSKDPMDQDGLKLRIELNLDIEIELKAKIHGDLTLALM